MTQPSVSPYRYFAVDLITGLVGIELPLTSVQATKQLNSPGQFQASMPVAGFRNADGTLNNPLIAACMDATNPGQSSVAVFRNNSLVGEWQITQRPTRVASGTPVQLQGYWISNVLANVVPAFSSNISDLPASGYPGPASTPVGPGTDQLQVAWDLVNQAVNPGTLAPAGSNGYAISLPTRSALSSGVLLTLTDWPSQQNTVLAMLTQIQQANSFDWDIAVSLSPDSTTIIRTLILASPEIGSNNGISFLMPEWGGQGGNIVDFEANDDGTRLATQVLAVGGGSPAQVARATNTALVAGLPLIQKIVSLAAITDAGQLAAQATAAAAYAESTAIPPTVTVLADTNPQFGSYDCGDTVTVNVGPSPVFPYGLSQVERITSWQINPPVAGDEVVTLTVSIIAG